MKHILWAALAACLLLMPASAQDASSVWNSHCAGYGFPVYPTGGSLTFAQVWPASGFTPSPGMTCQTQLDACSAAVSAELHVAIPDWDDDDVLDYAVTNWP